MRVDNFYQLRELCVCVCVCVWLQHREDDFRKKQHMDDGDRDVILYLLFLNSLDDVRDDVFLPGKRNIFVNDI